MAAAISSSCNTLSPLAQWLIGGEDHRPFLQVPIVDHMEEHVGSVRTVGQISDLIDHQNMRVGIGRERLLEVSSLASIGEILDEFRFGGEESLEAVRMARYPMATAGWVLPLPVLPCRINDRPSVTKSSPR